MSCYDKRRIFSLSGYNHKIKFTFGTTYKIIAPITVPKSGMLQSAFGFRFTEKLMGYQYGIGVCRQTLLYLSSNESFENRLFKGFSEIDVIHEKDASPDHRKQIRELKQKYLSIKKEGFTVNDKGALAEPDKETEFKELAHSLTWLCVEIIEHNARKSTKV